ncbi:MAG TPA: orotidine-5'-phosphate decarboxylase [Hyphomicrobiaceae bacterium]|nr:orotidine-5'-phosphate decarboxylase [Hyphomicrobiaceae bacterium]
MRRGAERIFVALDVPTVEAARALVDTLGDSVGGLKIGLELVMGGGLKLAEELAREGRRVFLDMKLLDIPNTVEGAAANAAEAGVAYLTVHGTDRKTLDAAVKGRGNSKTKLLAITVLTSLGSADLREQGSTMAVEELVVHRARLANAAGFDGVVASPLEIAAIRAAVGQSLEIVTPGVRPAGAARGDQTRVMTPAEAIRAGATALVVGRPITAVADPRAAALAIGAEIEAALG